MTAGETFVWSELLKAGQALYHSVVGHLDRGPIAFIVDDHLSALQAVIYSLNHKLDALVLDKERASDKISLSLFEEGYHVLQDRILTLNPKPRRPVSGRISVTSSGTTGSPKIRPHLWETLNTYRGRQAEGRSWLSPYQVGTYSWYQLVCMSLFQPNQRVLFVLPNDMEATFEAAKRYGVTAVSSTPTFWRSAFYLVDEETLRGVELNQITLGGEIVDQAILDRLQTLYPSARISHVYASSEVGAVIVTKDGKAGFSASRLAKPFLDVRGNRLWVKTRHTSEFAEHGKEVWVDSGDIVGVVGDRAYIIGRADEGFINVGGNKVYSSGVESHLYTHPSVLWCRVHARKAPIVGNLVAADIVLSRDMTEVPVEKLKFLLVSHCKDALPAYSIPRVWLFVDEIPLRRSLKS